MTTLRLNIRVSAGIGLLCCAMTNSLGHAAQNPPSVEQVIEGLQQIEKLFFDNNSLIMRFERTASKNVTENTNGPADLLLVKWTYAFKDNDWYSSYQFTNPRKNADGTVVPAKPFVELARAGYRLHWNESGDNASVTEFDLRNNFYVNEYTQNLSLNLPKYVADSLGIEERMFDIRKTYRRQLDLPYLPEFMIKNKDKYRVLPDTEDVDGVTCYVVEWPGMDRVCVDPRHGFALCRRTYSWGPGEPTRFRVDNRDHRQVKPGLWLPFTQVQNRYFSPSKRSAGKVQYRTEYKLLSIEFDQVPDALFDVKLPVGTLVYDAVRDFHYSVGAAGADPFEIPLAQAKGEASPSRARTWFLGANVAIVILLAVVLLWRYFGVIKRRAAT